MFKKPLVISDNTKICRRFIDEVLIPFNLLDVFTFSSQSNALNSIKKIFNTNIFVLDLKEIKDVEFIKDNFDLVISMHCKQIFPKSLIECIKCINVHPGYNPYNRGWYPHIFSIINGYPVGATIHEIDDKIDHGNIIARKSVDISVTDTSDTLYEKVVAIEMDLLKDNLMDILNNHYNVQKPELKGNFNSKKDFERLCQIDLSETLSFLEAINRLRALTHGEYKNAYFFDPITKKKVYIKIELSYD